MITAKMFRTETGICYSDRHDSTRVAAAFRVGQALEVEIRKWSDKRSDRQRRTIHAIWRRQAEYYQCSPEDMKLFMKYLYGDKVSIEDILEHDWPDWPGQPYNPTKSPLAAMHENLEDKTWYLRSEADYSIDDERYMIDQMINFCFAADIDIEDILQGMEREKAKSEAQS